MSAFDFGMSKQIDTFGGKKNFLPDPDQRWEANANKISHYPPLNPVYRRG
jgi:hypothetical protein